MSTGTEAGLPEPDGLQFEHAEFEQATPTTVDCVACKRPISDQYFEINGTVVCESCKDAIRAKLLGGSWLIRFLLAGIYGLGAAVVGAVGYFLVRWASGMDLSLVSVLVGYLVGKMVRKGSGGMGGVAFQILAVALTYFAIALTYLFLILATNPELMAVLNGAPSHLVALLIFSMRMPVLVAQESPISIAIVGFALWQAWKMAQRLKLVVTGPYLVGAPESAGLIQEPSDHA